MDSFGFETEWSYKGQSMPTVCLVIIRQTVKETHRQPLDDYTLLKVTLRLSKNLESGRTYDNACSLTMSVTDPSYAERRKEGRKEGNVFILTTHSTHFIYGYMASDIL